MSKLKQFYAETRQDRPDRTPQTGHKKQGKIQGKKV